MRLISRMLLLLLIVWPVSAQAAWRRAESNHFVVYSEESEARMRIRIGQLEDFHNLLVLLTDASTEDSPNKLHIYVVGNRRELTTIRQMGRNVAGFYSAGVESVFAVVDNSVEGSRSNEILFHEYAHHFMMQYLTGSYPAWYVEGFAEFLMTAKLESDRIDIGQFSQGRVYSAAEGPWLPIERIVSAGPRGLDSEGGAAYYAQAWLMTHYFFSTPERQAALRRYLTPVRGETQVQALVRATGMPIEQFTRELRRYIGRGSITYRRMARSGAAAVGPVQVTTLTAAADDVLLLDAAVRGGLGDEEAPALLQQIRTAAARHPQDALARRTLARAEIFHGDRAAALRLLEPLHTELPNDAELMYLRGRLHLENADKDGDEAQIALARAWFSRAHRADPNQFQSLYRFAQSYRHEPGLPSENTANALLLAQQLAPQVIEIRLNAAAMQIARGEVDYAAALLRPVLTDPHRPELAAEAQRLIDAARAGEAGPEDEAAPASSDD